MIRMCAWCDTYMGEKPPYEDTSITGGMCDRCLKAMQRELASNAGGGTREKVRATRQDGLEARRGTSMGLRGSDPPAILDGRRSRGDMGAPEMPRDEIGADRRPPTAAASGAARTRRVPSLPADT